MPTQANAMLRQSPAALRQFLRVQAAAHRKTEAGRRALDATPARRNHATPVPETSANGSAAEALSPRLAGRAREGVAAKTHRAYLRPMDQPETQPCEAAETEAERAARIAWEDRATEEAEDEAEREGTIAAEEVFAWLHSLDTENPLPEPELRKDDVWRRMNKARAAERARAAVGFAR